MARPTRYERQRSVVTSAAFLRSYSDGLMRQGELASATVVDEAAGYIADLERMGDALRDQLVAAQQMAEALEPLRRLAAMHAPLDAYRAAMAPLEQCVFPDLHGGA